MTTRRVIGLVILAHVVVIYAVSEIIRVAYCTARLVFSTNSETLMLSKTIPISMYVYHCVLGVVDGCTHTYKDLYTRTFFSTCSRLTNDSHDMIVTALACCLISNLLGSSRTHS